jgi:hypothetical protein
LRQLAFPHLSKCHRVQASPISPEKVISKTLTFYSSGERLPFFVAIRDSQAGDTPMAEVAIALGLGAAGFLAYGAMFGCVYCNDGWLSRSFGKRGACSWHGGWRD